MAALDETGHTGLLFAPQERSVADGIVHFDGQQWTPREAVQIPAGSEGEFHVLAIDGYNQEIEMREIEQWPILLALKEDGKYMPLGGFGPTRIVFPRRDVPALADRNDDKWVWAVVQIGVE